MSKTLGKELLECFKPPTEKEQQETISDMVNFDFFCNKFTSEILDWVEENCPDEVIKRGERASEEQEKKRIENMTPKELKADEA